MVQMKGWLEAFWLLQAKFLYIPHGSDERIPTATVVTSLTIFISHMVQMKDEKA